MKGLFGLLWNKKTTLPSLVIIIVLFFFFYEGQVEEGQMPMKKIRACLCRCLCTGAFYEMRKLPHRQNLWGNESHGKYFCSHQKSVFGAELFSLMKLWFSYFVWLWILHLCHLINITPLSQEMGRGVPSGLSTPLPLPLNVNMHMSVYKGMDTSLHLCFFQSCFFIFNPAIRGWDPPHVRGLPQAREVDLRSGIKALWWEKMACPRFEP